MLDLIKLNNGSWLTRAASLIIVFTFATGLAGAQEESGGNDYVVKPGDQLLISVWKEEDLRQEVLIRPDGGFSFPLAGDMNATGMSVDDISEALSRKLKRYIPDLVVTVAVTAINGNKIYVIGQVNNPGAFIMNPRLDVMQALSVAGGATPFAALNDIKILRRNASGQAVFQFRYGDVEDGRNLEQNIMLESGDVVVVP
jgi:polysaccharide biosynthesis/export protein